MVTEKAILGGKRWKRQERLSWLFLKYQVFSWPHLESISGSLGDLPHAVHWTTYFSFPHTFSSSFLSLSLLFSLILSFFLSLFPPLPSLLLCLPAFLPHSLPFVLSPFLPSSLPFYFLPPTEMLVC